MPYSGEVRRDERFAKLRDAICGRQLLHVKTTIEVYRRNDETGEAECIDERPDLDLLINPIDGYRKLRHEANDPEAWDKLAAGAKLVHVKITCSEKQVEIILNGDARVVGIISGARAGKTHAAALWLFRRWMLRSAKGASFWWIAPDWSQTEIGVNKLFRGNGQAPAVFPPELVSYFPKDKNQARQYAEIVDGSRIEFKQAGGRGDNLKGFEPRDIVIDEGTAIRHRENWTVALNRLTTHQGNLMVSTTPVAGHWLRNDVIVRAQTEDVVSHYEISIFDNPWEHPETIEELIIALGGHDDPVVRREFYGEWLPTAAALWPEWRPEAHLVQDRSGEPAVWDIEQLIARGYIPDDYVDLTDRVAAGFWQGHRGARFIGGQDFNIHPCSTVIAKVFGRESDRKTWGLFFVDEVLTRGTIQNHCKILGRDYPGLAISCDSTGAQRNGPTGQGLKGSATNVTEMRRLGFDCKPCMRVRGKALAPRQIDSLNIFYRLQIENRIIVSARCRKLCHAFDVQERDWDGGVKKQPNTESDRVSGPSDAARYLVWPLFKHELKNKVGNYGES